MKQVTFLTSMRTIAAISLAVYGSSLSAGSAQEADAAPAITVVRAAKGCFTDAVFFTGLIVPRDEILVVPEVEGARVSELVVDEGATVKAGQVLAKLTRGAAEGRGSESIDVKAPKDGLVIRRAARIGAVVSPASPEPLFRIARGGDVEIDAELPQARLRKVAQNQTATITVPGQEPVAGTVVSVSPEIDRQTRLGRVRISVRGDPRQLRLGASVTGAIEAGRSCGVEVPVSALLADNDVTAVRVVREHRVETRAVRTGLIEGPRAEVREGIAEGDLVVARAGGFLRDGDTVRAIVSEAAKTADHREDAR